jgi:hypothetical protein
MTSLNDAEPSSDAKAETETKPGKGNHPNSRKNLKRDAGPGRPPGTRDRFSQENIQRFVAQYRNDLANDWNKHGAAFVESCRERLPQIYATMQRMRMEDELARVQAEADGLSLSHGPVPAVPFQIREPTTYREPNRRRCRSCTTSRNRLRICQKRHGPS